MTIKKNTPKKTVKSKAAASSTNEKTVQVGKNGPNMAYLKDMAKALSVIGYSKLGKPELIHAIQLAEGNSDCYQRIADCTLSACLFYSPCQEAR